MSFFCIDRRLFRSGFILDAFELIVPFLETFDTTCGVNDLLLSRKERMA